MKRHFGLRGLILCGASCFLACAPRPPSLSSSVGIEPDGGAGPRVLYFLSDTNAGRASMGAFALSEDYLNFTVSPGGVYRIPKYGGEAAPIEVDSQSFFRYVGARADTVAWIRAPYDSFGTSPPPRLRKLTIGQDAVTLAEIAADTPAPVPFIPELQVTSTSVFFNDGAPHISQVALADGAATIVALPEEARQPDWLADESFVFYLSPRPPDGCALSQIVLGDGAALELAGCPPAAVRPWLVAIDATDVYLGASNGFWRIPKEGGTPVAIYAPAGADVILPRLAAIDDQNIYFLRSAGATPLLTSTPKAGGTPTTIWDGVRGGLGDVAQLAQDGPSLFTRHPWGIQIFPKTPAD